ncbi:MULTISPECIES: alpha/beta hydrolase [unclassified Roseitalea]|uniref:alpha/beta hydrolase n=1 Tax=unclassified Roseitalea TaxID=2639107 RepID=UPI00273E71CF|nr:MULTISPECIES: alpha/beta hydrolase [unclassified Roseitalea]
MMQPIWAKLSPEEHEFQYNPQHAFPDFAKARAKRAPYNDRAREALTVTADVPFGAHALRRLDIYPAAKADAPVHVFIHGGYWRAQDKANFAFIAGALVPHGITTVIVNYELCPASTLDGVVDSAIAGFGWIARNIGAHGGDPARITLSGHSAGAHLGAAIMAHDWPEPTAMGLTGVVLTSGIYDPAPAIHTSVNAQLNLDAAIAARHNVERRAPVLRPDVTILAGAGEPDQFVDQSFRYYHNLRAHGFEPALHVLAGYDHFNILDEYLDADSVTMRTILRQCGVAKEGRP